jgi:hypothetical protein
VIDYIRFVIRTIVAIKFAKLWHAQSSTDTGRKWKKDYQEKLFQEICKDHINRLRTVGAARVNTLRSMKQQVVRKHEKVITARNHLRTLYTTVCHLMFQEYLLMTVQFGAAILLDPTWQAELGVDKINGRSNSFGKTVDKLILAISNVPSANAEDEEVLLIDELREQGRKFLTKILGVIGGIDLLKYVQDFLKEEP